MRRREFIGLLGGVAVTFPLATRAQQPMVPVVGFLGVRSPAELTHLVGAFRQGLKETGYVEDRNVEIEYRWAENHYDRLPTLATELADRRVTVIAATGGGVSALAAKAVITTIPIVFVVADLDPVKSGLVESLNRPGGNITGIAPFTSPLAGKRAQLLHELVPNATVIAFLVNPANPGSESEMRDVRSAALALGLQLVVANANSELDFDTAFIALAGQQVRALIVASDPMFVSRREELIALTARYAMAAIYPLREFATNGGLLSYAPSLADAYRLTGVYVGKILNGEKPADLPIMQPTKFELVINLKAAKAMGLAVSNSMQLLADEVIE